jgi:hypothetical protein
MLTLVSKQMSDCHKTGSWFKCGRVAIGYQIGSIQRLGIEKTLGKILLMLAKSI